MEKSHLFIPMKYEGLQGKFRREILPTDIFSLSVTDTANAGSTVVSTTITSSFDVYITGISAFSSSIASIFIFTGTTPAASTFTAMRLEAATQKSVIGTKDAPLLKISGASTISIGTSGGSFSGAIWGVREPIFSRVETR